MGILITNDDGIESVGIKRLIDAVKNIDDIYICAPSREQSAKSHSITIYQELHFEKHDKNIYAVDGTPADCVRLGTQVLFKDKIDLVISGINAGMNIGIDTYYSGTVGAAREGVINGIHSIAYSFEHHRNMKNDFTHSAETAKIITSKIQSLIKNATIKKPTSLYDALFLNVNIPQEKPKGIRLTNITEVLYKDAVKVADIDERRKKIMFSPTKTRTEENTNSDLSALIEGYTSITPLSVRLGQSQFTESFLKEVLL